MKFTEKNLTLNNGVAIPQLGFGLFMISNKEKEKGIKAIQTAFETGYRLMSGAHFYRTYELILEGMQRAKVKRKDVFLTTKIANWSPNFKIEADTRAEVQEALTKLQTDYLDLVLVHSANRNAVKVYHVLEKLYEEGVVKAIGVSNFNKPILEDFIKHVKIKPAVNEVQLSPALNQQELYDFCKKERIYIIAWRPLGPRASTSESYLKYFPVMQEIAEKYHCSVPHVALQWAAQKGIIIIPKSINPERIKANSELDSFHLTEEEMKAIHDLPQIYPYWPFTYAAQKYPDWDLTEE